MGVEEVPRGARNLRRILGTAQDYGKARWYFGRSCMNRMVVCREKARRTRRGSRRARPSAMGNQTCDVAEAIALTRRLRLAIFSCIDES